MKNELIGQKFSRLTVMKYSAETVCVCKCDCGNDVIVYENQLLREKRKSCGCMNTKNSIDENYFKKIDSAEKSFWLGFLCADASIHKSHNSFHLTITQRDDRLIRIFNKHIKSSYRIREEVSLGYTSNNYYRLIISNNIFTQNLMLSGKDNYKRNLKEIPKCIPQEYIKDFIRGFFEGDGSLFYSNKSWHLQFSANFEIASIIKEYFNENIFGKDIGSISKDLKYGGNKCVPSIIKFLYYDKNCLGIKNEQYNIA